MTATETTGSETRSDWDAAYDRNLRNELEQFASEHDHDLDKMLVDFNERVGTPSEQGWYGFASTFTNRLGWEAENLLKAEFNMWVALALRNWLKDEESAERCLELLDGSLRSATAQGLRNPSSSEMANTLQRMRGAVALDWGSYSSGPDSWKWAAYYRTLREVAGDEDKAFADARRELREAKSRLDRTRSESGQTREQRNVTLAERAVEGARLDLSNKLKWLGAPSQVVEQATKDTQF